MLYAFVRPFAKLAISIYFKKIYLSNTARIPKGKPVILACNHPTAFLEPCILACFLDRPLYFLVRGDFFKRPIQNFLLRALNMLPIFRKKDGDYNKLKTNYETFEACYKALSQNKTLMIFPEGHAVLEYRLRPLHKGIGRIVTGIFEKYPELEELYIVPVGVNYSKATQFRSTALIDFGEPFSTKKYTAYEENKAVAINTFMEDLSAAMKEQMIIVEKSSHDILAERLISMELGIAATENTTNKQDHALRKAQAMAKNISKLSDPERMMLEKETELYEIELLKHGLEDHTLLEEDKSLIKLRLLSYVSAPFAALGYLLNYFPNNYVRKIVDKKVNRVAYYPPVIISLNLGVYFMLVVFFLLLGLIVSWWILLVPILLLSLGFVYIKHKEWSHLLTQAFKKRKITSSKQDELLKSRAKIMAKLIS